MNYRIHQLPSTMSISRLVEHFERDSVMRSHTFVFGKTGSVVTSSGVMYLLAAVGVFLLYVIIEVEVQKLTS